MTLRQGIFGLFPWPRYAERKLPSYILEKYKNCRKGGFNKYSDLEEHRMRQGAADHL